MGNLLAKHYVSSSKKQYTRNFYDTAQNYKFNVQIAFIAAALVNKIEHFI